MKLKDIIKKYGHPVSVSTRYNNRDDTYRITSTKTTGDWLDTGHFFNQKNGVPDYRKFGLEVDWDFKVELD